MSSKLQPPILISYGEDFAFQGDQSYPDVVGGFSAKDRKAQIVCAINGREPDELDSSFGRQFAGGPGTPRAYRRAAARALYRIFNAAAYRFYRSNVRPPLETDSPFATSAMLPNQPSNTYADGTWYLSMSYFNGVIDSGFLPLGAHGETYLKLELLGGVALPTRPMLPVSAWLEVRSGGVIRARAIYAAIPDGANAATEWAIAYTINGTTPPSNTPTLTPTMTTGPLRILAYDLPSQAEGTTVRVQLQTRRGGTVYSLPAAVMSAIASMIGPSGVLSIGEGA